MSKNPYKVQSLSNQSVEVQNFLKNRGRIILLPLSKGGSSKAPVDPEFREIFGEILFCENSPIKGSFNGRDHVRQRSQKIDWTRKVRTVMGETIQTRDHKEKLKEMRRNGELELRTGTEG